MDAPVSTDTGASIAAGLIYIDGIFGDASIVFLT